MRAINRHHPTTQLSRTAGFLSAIAIAMTFLGGTVSAADSRDYSVNLSTPTPVSAGGATKIDIDVVSTDNQTIANMHLSVPSVGTSLPAGVTVTAVFGPDRGLCSAPTAAGLSCNLGNLAALGERHISILVSVAASWPANTPLTLTASAETNNENGSNLQVETGSTSVTPGAFNANSITTYNLTGEEATSALGTTGAGNLQTKVKLLQNNGGVGNAIAIVEGTDTTQPAYCVTLKLTCQLDFATVTVNGGAAVTPYLETTLTAIVSNKYNLKKAFVIHVLDNGSVETGFPLYNVAATSCAAHPTLVPCADFSQAGNIVTILVHTFGNGKFNY